LSAAVHPGPEVALVPGCMCVWVGASAGVFALVRESGWACRWGTDARISMLAVGSGRGRSRENKPSSISSQQRTVGSKDERKRMKRIKNRERRTIIQLPNKVSEVGCEEGWDQQGLIPNVSARACVREECVNAALHGWACT
jgi:hypothetical protein